jgi:hypothetical protein
MEKEDEKKKSKNKYIRFVKNFISVLVLGLIMFIFGSWVFYLCKLSQLNIFPTDADCYPYTENKADIKFKNVNINVFGEESEKITADPSQKNDILSLLSKIFNSERNQSGISMFFINIFKEFFIFNMQIIQNIFGTINSTLSESVILFLSPYFLAFAFPLVLFIDCIYIVYLWFSNLYWVFKKNLNKNKDHLAKWSDITIGDPINFGLSVFIAVILIITIIVLFFIPIPIISGYSLFILFGVLLTGLFEVCKKGDEKYTYLNSLSDNFKYHMRTIMILLTFFLILSVSASFGGIYGGVVLLTSLLLYFKVIPIPVYLPTIPEKLTPITDYNVAEKRCSLKEIKNGDFIGGAYSKDGFFQTINHIKKLVKKHNK